jgi:hypothetical protein
MKYSILGLSLATIFVSAASYSANIPHPVGSCYGNGIVFYVNKEPHPGPGRRGLIVALKDAYSDYAMWGAPLGSVPRIDTFTSYFSGKDNTANIVAAFNNLPILVAGQIASQYTTPDLNPCPSCTSWYLPSQAELATLHYQSSNFNDFWMNQACKGDSMDGGYWSSTQYDLDPNQAWYVNFSSGIVLNQPASFPNRIRAIRAF